MGGQVWCANSIRDGLRGFCGDDLPTGCGFADGRERRTNAVRNRGIEGRGDCVGLAVIDEICNQQLVAKSFGMISISKEYLQATHLRVCMNDYTPFQHQSGYNRSSKRNSVGVRSSAKRIEHFDLKYCPAGNFIQRISGDGPEASLQTEIQNCPCGELNR